MTPLEVLEDIVQWQTKIKSLGLDSNVRYSHVEHSAYISIPLSLSSSAYPDELLTDLAGIGIVLIGGSSATLGDAPGVMGLAGRTSTGGDRSPTNSSIDAKSMRSLGYNWVYSTGPSRSQNIVPTQVVLMKTTDWALTPDMYRNLFPEDTTTVVPPYRHAV